MRSHCEPREAINSSSAFRYFSFCAFIAFILKSKWRLCIDLIQSHTTGGSMSRESECRSAALAASCHATIPRKPSTHIDAQGYELVSKLPIRLPSITSVKTRNVALPGVALICDPGLALSRVKNALNDLSPVHRPSFKRTCAYLASAHAFLIHSRITL